MHQFIIQWMCEEKEKEKLNSHRTNKVCGEMLWRLKQVWIIFVFWLKVILLSDLCFYPAPRGRFKERFYSPYLHLADDVWDPLKTFQAIHIFLFKKRDLSLECVLESHPIVVCGYNHTSLTMLRWGAKRERKKNTVWWCETIRKQIGFMWGGRVSRMICSNRMRKWNFLSEFVQFLLFFFFCYFYMFLFVCVLVGCVFWSFVWNRNNISFPSGEIDSFKSLNFISHSLFNSNENSLPVKWDHSFFLNHRFSILNKYQKKKFNEMKSFRRNLSLSFFPCFYHCFIFLQEDFLFTF